MLRGRDGLDSEADHPEPPAGYVIIKPLGKGGGGRVFSALRVGAGKERKERALKYPKPGEVERLAHEITLGRDLGVHPNIACALERAEVDGVPVLVMDICGEDTLHERGGGLSLAEIAHVLYGVAAALDHAHGKGIIHRDVKPKNVIIGAVSEARRGGYAQVGQVGRVCLVDWGIAIRLGDDRTTWSCTPGYAGDGEPNAPSLDILQLVATTYEVLTGKLPFAVTASGVMALRPARELEADLARSRARDLPPGFEQTLIDALRSSPLRRPKSATLFVESLFAPRGLTRPTRPVAPRPLPEADAAAIDSVGRPVVSPPQRDDRSHLVQIASLSLSVVVLALALFLARWPSGDAGSAPAPPRQQASPPPAPSAVPSSEVHHPAAERGSVVANPEEAPRRDDAAPPASVAREATVARSRSDEPDSSARARRPPPAKPRGPQKPPSASRTNLLDEQGPPAAARDGVEDHRRSLIQRSIRAPAGASPGEPTDTSGD